MLGVMCERERNMRVGRKWMGYSVSAVKSLKKINKEQKSVLRGQCCEAMWESSAEAAKSV